MYGKKENINSFKHTETFIMYVICIQETLKRIEKYPIKKTLIVQ